MVTWEAPCCDCSHSTGLPRPMELKTSCLLLRQFHKHTHPHNMKTFVQQTLRKLIETKTKSKQTKRIAQAWPGEEGGSEQVTDSSRSEDLCRPLQGTQPPLLIPGLGCQLEDLAQSPERSRAGHVVLRLTPPCRVQPSRKYGALSWVERKDRVPEWPCKEHDRCHTVQSPAGFT